MSKYDAGPAYPRTKGVNEDWSNDGMSLRDYFAGQALPALLLRSNLDELVAAKAYEHADKMLEERAK